MMAAEALPEGIHAKEDALGIATTEDPVESVHVPRAQAVVVIAGSGTNPGIQDTLIVLTPLACPLIGTGCWPALRPRGVHTG